MLTVVRGASKSQCVFKLWAGGERTMKQPHTLFRLVCVQLLEHEYQLAAVQCNVSGQMGTQRAYPR
jgi:hypothetical protein